MPLTINDRTIRRVRIVDDEPSVRNAYELSVEDLDLEPVQAEGPLLDLVHFIDETMEVADAAILDHQLRVSNYADFDGAETVAKLYQRQFPAVLCTTYGEAKIDEMRRYRRYIPVLLNPDELEPESLVRGFEQCVQEFSNHYQPSRKPWRTLLRVETEGQEKSEWAGFFFVVIPAWDPHIKIRLRRNDLPCIIQKRIAPGARFHAHVNIGAETHEELFFENWEDG